MRMKSVVAALAAVGVVATGATVGLRPEWFTKKQPQVIPTSVAAAEAAASVLPAISGGAVQPDYRAIVKQSGPAVVGIRVAGVRTPTLDEGGVPPGFEEDPFFRFFRGIPGRPDGRGNRGEPFRGMGSGFIISPDGIVLTNAHVVRDAKEVSVKLSDRREHQAKVLGIDTSTDVAVLRIDAKGLPTVRLGDVKQVEVGDPVLAIGAPYGFEQTATKGIVSAKGRSLPGGAVVPLIQTDAAVNPGNSGGPLFDGNGAVVGITSQIYSRSGGFQGLSFAIPINVALKVKDQIVATGKATHGRLGVAVQDLTQSLAESFGLSRPDGALVASVTPNSAAAAAGLKPGDVITEVDGQPIVRSGELSSLVGMTSPGDRIRLRVWREGTSRQVEARLGTAETAGPTTETGASGADGQLGLSLRPLTVQERREAKVEQGLLVEDVVGAAARSGIEVGDVLLAINGKPVQTVEQVRSLLKTKPKSVAILLQRDGERIFVPLQLG